MKKRGQTILYIAIVLFSIAVEVLYILFGLRYAQNQSVLYIVCTAFMLCLASFLAIFVVDIFHELGHLFVAICCGFSVQKVSLSFLTFDRQTGKTKVYFSNPFGKLAGETVVLPKTEKGIKGKFICITLGGLLFTALFVAMGVTAFCLYNRLYFWGYLLLIAALPYAVYLLFFNSLPIELGGLSTDGKVLFDFIQGGAEAILLQTLLAIEGGLMQGKTPKEISANLYRDDIVLAEDNLYFILHKVQKLYRALDAENIDSALQLALQLLQLEVYFIEEYRAKILTEILFVLTLYTEDNVADYLAESLKEHLWKDTALATVRTRLARAAKEKGFQSIEQEWQKAYDNIAKQSIVGIAKFERKLLNDLKREFLEV